MPLTLLGAKLGMTRTYTSDGLSVPVTVIHAGPCVVTQIRTPEKDGYAAVQIGYDDVKPRRSTMPMIAHDAKAGTAPKRHHREFRVEEADLANYEIGQEITVEKLAETRFVDVTGTSKGKGYAGNMKRNNFKGMSASHGTERMHRRGGSIGGHGTNRGTGPKPKKGKKMTGRLGGDRSTVRSLEIIKIDPEQNLLLVKGPVPGANTGMLEIRFPKRLYKSKATKQAEHAKG
ncbi:MAG: 50S ribosomal protein L3 [Phycisphaerales bacterium]|nr:MAG: 50S ribosomal protein L3 [Phycisphaerales bacterium]